MAGILDVEWRHIGESVDATCERCASTGRTLAGVLDEICPMLSARRIRIRVPETVLPHDRIEESNALLFNGVPLEDLIDDVRIENTSWPSCACMTGTDAACRAQVCGGQTYDEIPADLIRRATLRAAGL